MRKRLKIGRTLKQSVIIAIIVALIILILGYLDQQNQIDILIKHHNIQETKIQELEQHSQRLNEVVSYQHELIKELQSHKSVTIVEQPQIHKEEVHNEDTQIGTDVLSYTPTVVVTTLVILGSMLRALPVIP